MGLDMYAFALPATMLDDPEQQVDINLPEDEATEFHYWRKHHDLHGWMHGLYERKGGADPDFNCNTVRLTSEDLDELEKAVKGEGGGLPVTTGFFFGDNPPDEESKADDLEFIRKAREYLARGFVVVYDSWW